MKKKITIATSTEKVITTEIEIDFRTTPAYYKHNDDGRFFPRGLVVLAILPKQFTDIPRYTLLEISKGIQQYTDFIPMKDCRGEEWLKEDGLREKALKLMMGNYYKGEYFEISRDEFEYYRTKLLDFYKEVEK